MRKTGFGWWAAALLALSLLSGCTTAAVVGGGGGAAAAMGEDRGLQGVARDTWLAWKLRYAFAKSDDVNVGNINVSIYQSKALLTGVAATEQEIREALYIARGMAGIEKVRSEVRVEHQSARDIAQDSALSLIVKGYLLADKYVGGLDIHVETVKGRVFLTGVAKSVQERDRAIKIARNVSGPIQVKEVVSYIEIAPARVTP